MTMAVRKKMPFSLLPLTRGCPLAGGTAGHGCLAAAATAAGAEMPGGAPEPLRQGKLNRSGSPSIALAAGRLMNIKKRGGGGGGSRGVRMCVLNTKRANEE